MSAPTAIVVDDEPHLRDYLIRLLGECWPQLDVVATAGSGTQALQLVGECAPEIAFLDIKMPGMSGLELAAELPAGMEVVFVSAWDDYAVAAFEQAAVDYLLKPVEAARLQATIERLQARRRSQSLPRQRDLRALLEQFSEQPQASHLHWLRTGSRDEVALVSVDDVVYFKADQKYTSVFTATREYLLRTSISELEQQLDPARFWRVHRSLIVAVAEIQSARKDLRGRYAITLRSRRERLRSSPAYKDRFTQS
ncbi:MAG: LytTR family DNA-binding domain-containing protein [Pseudomonadota bacterium]